MGSFFYETGSAHFNPLLGILIPIVCCLIGALLMGLIFCLLTVTLRANQNVTGLAMTTFGVGFGNFFGGSIIKLSGADVPSVALSATSRAFKTTLPFAGKAGVIGNLLLSYGFMTYVAILIAIITSYVLKKTRTGLELRAVGENPATADAAGINITKYKYFSICIGCMIAGLGGLYYVMDYANGVWSNDAFGDRGWLAIALVIFSIWRPNWAIWESMLFGALYILYLYIPTGTNFAMKEIYKGRPYIVTIIVLIAISLRNKHENQPPEALGLPYFREDR
jgi:simple sugar transport system permease protein